MVSIIIPCFNYGHFLPQTLDSVLAQTYQNWECIVVNDGSTDNTQAIMEEYIKKDKRFKHIYQPNQGQSATRNKGLSLATGNYIQFLDADDLLERRKLEEQVKFFKQYPAVDVVYGDVRYFISSIDPENLLFSRWGKNEPWMPQISGKGEFLIEQFLRGNIAELGSLLFRKNVTDEVGLWDLNIKACEDWEYCLRYAIAGKYFQFLDVKETCILMRHHPNSYSKHKEQMLQGAIAVHQKVNTLYSHKIGTKLQAVNLQCLYGNKRILGEYLMRKGNIWQGMIFLSQAYIYEQKTAVLCKKLIVLSYQRLKIELSRRISFYTHA